MTLSDVACLVQVMPGGTMHSISSILKESIFCNSSDVRFQSPSDMQGRPSASFRSWSCHMLVAVACDGCSSNLL